RVEGVVGLTDARERVVPPALRVLCRDGGFFVGRLRREESVRMGLEGLVHRERLVREPVADRFRELPYVAERGLFHVRDGLVERGLVATARRGWIAISPPGMRQSWGSSGVCPR